MDETGSDTVDVQPSQDEPQPAGQMTHLLVVDDNAVYCRLVTVLLESFSMTCTTASSGEEALELAQSQPFDGALLDIHMPGMDGIETATRLRTLPAWSERPILALTADPPSETDPRLAAARLTGVISKPIHADAFHQALMAAL